MRVETELPIGKVDPGLRPAKESLDLRTVASSAREIEELGYDGFVAIETKTDPFTPLALAATTTERIRLTTRTYREVFKLHGWGRLTDELSQLSRDGRWEDMPRLISDEVLETIAVVGSYDEVAVAAGRRYAGAATAIEFGIPLRSPADQDRLRAMLSVLRASS